MVRLKERKPYGCGAGVLAFQFLMVRLKVRLANAMAAYNIFQFLMVRLKGPRPAPRKRIEVEFQFLMVRLKDGNPTAVVLEYSHFNSLWFD